MAFDLKEKFVLQAEELLGARLPDSYRQAMMEANGGEVATEDEDWQLHPILDMSEKKRFSRSCNNIVLETKNCAEWHGFPERAVAIATNGSGDRLVFLKSGVKFEPTVYIWSHETGELIKVINDFSELDRL